MIILYKYTGLTLYFALTFIPHIENILISSCFYRLTSTFLIQVYQSPCSYPFNFLPWLLPYLPVWYSTNKILMPTIYSSRHASAGPLCRFQHWHLANPKMKFKLLCFVLPAHHNFSPPIFLTSYTPAPFSSPSLTPWLKSSSLIDSYHVWLQGFSEVAPGFWHALILD